MRSRSDGHDRRRGRSPEQLEKHLRELRAAWETNHCETQPEDKAEWPAVGVHRDNDEQGDNQIDVEAEPEIRAIAVKERRKLLAQARGGRPKDKKMNSLMKTGEQ